MLAAFQNILLEEQSAAVTFISDWYQNFKGVDESDYISKCFVEN